MSQWIAITAVDSIREDEPLAATAGGVPLAVVRHANAFFALYDLCSHGQARLSDGFVENGCIECPLHQGLIDLCTGVPRSAPIIEPVRVYPTRVVDGQLEVEI